jgi:hypothetical protein
LLTVPTAGEGVNKRTGERGMAGLMILQKRADLIFLHESRGAQARQITMKPLQPIQQRIRGDIDLCGEAFAVQAPQASQNVRDPRTPTKRFEKEELVIEDMWRPGIVRSKNNLADFVDPVDEFVDPDPAIERVGNRPQLKQVIVY